MVRNQLILKSIVSGLSLILPVLSWADSDAVNPQSLQGQIYQSTCSASPLYALATSLEAQSSRMQIEFKDNNEIVLNSIFYPGRECEGAPLATFEEKGRMELREGKSRDEAQFVDMTFLEVELVVNSVAGASLANRWNVCGFEDWTAGKQREVTPYAKSLSCYAASVPRRDYNLLKVEGDTLYMGKTGMLNRDASGRPTTLNRADPYLRLKR